MINQSILFEHPVMIAGSAAIVGKKEGEGPFGHLFDSVLEEDHFEQNTWEEAESMLQQETIKLAVEKSGLIMDQIDMIFSGDLLGQLIATSFGVKSFHKPLYGVYSACATIAEALQLGTFVLSSGQSEYVVCCASSHFATAEKQFRFPLSYANQRPMSATWTVTGCGAFVLGKKKGYVKITGITIGKIVDYGLHDSLNMGACMAPAAADTVAAHLGDLKRKPSDYDKIITGDLGVIGKEIFLKLMREKGYDVSKQHADCGIEIYGAKQNVQAGGSGCGCSAVLLSAYILDKIAEGSWSRVLFVPTGALLSTVSYNEGKSVPGIAHAVVFEKNFF